MEAADNRPLEELHHYMVEDGDYSHYVKTAERWCSKMRVTHHDLTPIMDKDLDF